MFSETISLSFFFVGKERRKKKTPKQHYFPLFEQWIIFSKVCKIRNQEK
jgi:hypothetical protein